MNPQDPLAALHPLREPELLDWWPLAPGWWILIGLLFIVIAVAVRFLLRWYRGNTYRRVALRQLQSLESEYQETRDDRQHIARINALLKSVALRAFPREQVAPQHGDAWLNFLNRSAAPGLAFDSEFVQSMYQRSCPEADIAALHQAARHWIKTHREAP